MLKKYQPVFFLVFILLLTTVVHWAGLKGGFLFDDYPNLKDLGTYGVIDSWEKVRNFTANGIAGPTGRPISLLSFLIDANTWPADPYPFKYTNLMLHLLNGVLLCWCILLLLKNYNYKEQQVLWIALVASAIWLLHPYFVSTTLYIVQRMAQLATLFSLIGFIAYLKYRLLISTKPIKAYIGMSVFIGLTTVLATYSKENGALLPFLVLVMELCNPNKNNQPIWQWRVIFLWLPSCAVIYLIFRDFTLEVNPWPNRNFNMIERLYSEARIVTEYLYNLAVPQIELRGLYQDGYFISKSLLNPITTLYSCIFLFFIFCFSVFYKNKYPLISLAILFFLVAHLMESTVIGLELYFEHRNYLAAIFLFLPIANGLFLLKNKIDDKLVVLVVGLILSTLSFFTYERVKLWSNTESLEMYWAKNSPNSPRAQSSIARLYIENGYVVEANTYLEQAIQRMPESTLLNLNLLLQKVYIRVATESDFQQTSNRMKTQPFDAQAVQALRSLTEYIVEENLTQQYGRQTLLLIQTLEKNKNYNTFPLFQRLMPYLKAKIYMGLGDIAQSLDSYILAVKYYADVEAGMMMVSELGVHHPLEALQLLNQVEMVYKQQSISSLKRSKKEYDFEIDRIRIILTKYSRDRGI